MVVAESAAFPLALVLDEVHEVVPLPAEGAAPPPPGSPAFLAGMARSGERVMMLLEPDGLLGGGERERIADALAEAARSAESPAELPAAGRAPGVARRSQPEGDDERRDAHAR
jgi:hypothetical protein